MFFSLNGICANFENLELWRYGSRKHDRAGTQIQPSVKQWLSVAARSYIATARVHSRGLSLSGCRCSYLKQFTPARHFCTFVACLLVTSQDSSFYYTFLPTPVPNHVQRLRSDTSRFEHYRRSCHLLTYLRVDRGTKKRFGIWRWVMMMMMMKSASVIRV